MRVERWRWRAGLLAAAFCISGSGCVADGDRSEAANDEATPHQAEEATALASGHRARVSATPLARTDDLNFGVAGDARFVFVTQPFARRVAVLDRESGRMLGEVPPPPGGFLLPFTVRVPRPGHLVVLDPGGFPSPTVPSVARVYDYEVRERHGHGRGHGHDDDDRGFEAELVRTVSFAGLPLVFAEDVEVTDAGFYVLSESIIGALWVIHPDGSIAPGLFPDSPDPAAAIPAIGPCIIPDATIGGVPFHPAGNFGPGVLSLASRDGWLYFSSTCRGGVQRIPLASLVDPARSPSQRAEDIEVVSPRPAGEAETFEGLAFNRFDRHDDALYASDSFRLQVTRIDVRTGRREVLVHDPVLFNFPTEMQFLPPRHGRATLLVASDQEYRLAAINAALTADILQPPFVVTEVELRDRRR